MVLSIALVWAVGGPWDPWTRSQASELPAVRERIAGHPRSRLPLSVHADPALDVAVVRRAVSDWNDLFTGRLGTAAFIWSEQEANAAVVLRLVEPGAQPEMGLTSLTADERDVIRLPILITLAPPVARGETSADRLLYQVVAHELGHALGLPHDNQPASLMCCDPGSLNFDDPAVRAAYVAARRRPDLRSVAIQLVTHYARFWGQ